MTSTARTSAPSPIPSGPGPHSRCRLARQRDPNRRNGGEAMAADPLESEFTEYRPRLLGIAYRILGSAWDAEDVVADAMIRWMDLDRERIREPLAFLTTVVTRLAIDQLRSARATRETYVGEWLPEPVATDPTRLGPLDTVERRETVSLATLRMLEALTPPERAVLVLHEAFGLTHAEVGKTIGVTEAGARQHLRRARRHLDRDPEHTRTPFGDEALDRFLAALEDGDLDQVQDLLAADVASYSDGGGRARAAHRPVVGAESVVRFIDSLRRHLPVRDVRRVDVNGQGAATLWFGRQFTLLALEVRNDEIQEIHWIMNPRKLRYLNHQLAEAPKPARPSEQPAT
jgi:RNA polymerase sigma-70 factor, ECF subfamily